MKRFALLLALLLAVVTVRGVHADDEGRSMELSVIVTGADGESAEPGDGAVAPPASDGSRGNVGQGSAATTAPDVSKLPAAGSAQAPADSTGDIFGLIAASPARWRHRLR